MPQKRQSQLSEPCPFDDRCLSEDGGLGITAHKHSDEVERLEIWISEHQVRSGKLDHKLREASHLRNRVLSLLAALSGMIDDKLEFSKSSKPD